MKISNSIILVINLLLIGCGSDKDNNTQVEAESDAKEKQQTKILDPHLKTLNEAKAMEKNLQDAEAARKKRMEEQEKTTESRNPD